MYLLTGQCIPVSVWVCQIRLRDNLHSKLNVEQRHNTPESEAWCPSVYQDGWIVQQARLLFHLEHLIDTYIETQQ